MIILITDGARNEGPKLDDKDLLNRIRSEEVRIVTMAIGTSADQKLENFATITDGKTYFVPDGRN